MIRKSRTYISGVELPEEFSGATVINNIAISGKQYAYVKNGDIIIGDIPSDGKLNIDGNVMNIKKGNKERQGTFNIGDMSAGRRIFISDNVQIGGDISISSGRVSIGSNLEYEIDETYDKVKKVTLIGTSNDIKLGIRDADNSVSIVGLTSGKPEIKNENLFINRLDGAIHLPESSDIEIEIDIRVSSGDVEGDIMHKGRIKTSSGDIDLDLYKPLIIETLTSSGDVNITKMISEGRGIYTPPNLEPVGTLVLETSSGDINVRYCSKQNDKKIL